MADSTSMSLDDIIRASRSRSRGGTNVRGRGGRGRGRGLVRRGRSTTRAETPGGAAARSRSRSRSRSQVRQRGRGRGRGRGRSQSRSRQQRNSTSRARSASRSRSQQRGLTPRGRAGLETQHVPLQNRIGRFRGGARTRVTRSRSTSNVRGDVRSRLGMPRGAPAGRGAPGPRGALAGRARRPLALAKRGIAKRGRSLTTRNRYNSVGLRSDQILKDQLNKAQNLLLQNNIIKSQTFTRSRSRSRSRNNSLSRNNSQSRRTRSNSRGRNNSRSRNNSFTSASQLTVSVANDLAKRRRRNSVGNANYLNKQSLVQLNNQLGAFKKSRGSGSVYSVGSNRSTQSDRSSRSNASGRSTGYRGRGRGRGRGRSRGVSRNFVNKQVLNTKLQKEIAAIQGKASNSGNPGDTPVGINFSPTPASTAQTLHQRFASS